METLKRRLTITIIINELGRNLRDFRAEKEASMAREERGEGR